MTKRFLTTAEYENEVRSASAGRVAAFVAVLSTYVTIALAVFFYASIPKIFVAPPSVAKIDWGTPAVHGDLCLQSQVDPRTAYWTNGACPYETMRALTDILNAQPGLRKYEPQDDTGMSAAEQDKVRR